jgi:hypothetical protein
MTTSYDRLIRTLNAETQKQVKDQLADVVDASQLLPYNQDGAGDFPYWITSGPANLFNNLTYNWIDQIVRFDEDRGALVSNGTDLIAQLQTSIYPKLSYALSSEDQKTLQAMQSKTTLEGNALVSEYAQNVAAIPAGTPNNLDYVTTQILTWGAASATLTLMDLKNTFDLAALLPRMPASGSAVLPALTAWLNAFSSALSLQNSSSFGNAYIAYLKSAVTNPNAATLIQTLDPSNPTAQAVSRPRWDVNIAANQIQNSLRNAGKAVKLTVSASNFSSSESQLSINGKVGGSFGWGWLEFGGSAGAKYNVQNANTSASSATVEITYPGITAVPLRAMQAQQGSGWLASTEISEAAKNGSKLPPAKSGYVFSPALPTSMSLKRNGTFGVINTVVISNQPTIKITYTSGDAKTFKRVFQQDSSWSVSFLGLFDIASGSQNYYTANVEESASGSGFSVTIAPDGTEFTVSDAQKRAKVLAVTPSWPADLNG